MPLLKVDRIQQSTAAAGVAIGLASNPKNSFWDETNSEWRVGDSPTLYSPSGQGDGRIVTRTEGGNNKHRLGTWGTGFQNFIAWDRARGTIAAPTQLLSGDVFGSIVGVGYGTAFIHGPELIFKTSENWDGTHAGSGMRFLTVIPGTVSQVAAAQLGMTATGRADFELPLGAILLGAALQAGTSDGEVILPNARYVRGNNAAAAAVKRLIGINASDQVSIDADAVGAIFGKGATFTAPPNDTRTNTYKATSSADVYEGNFSDAKYLRVNWYFDGSNHVVDATKGTAEMTLGVGTANNLSTWGVALGNVNAAASSKLLLTNGVGLKIVEGFGANNVAPAGKQALNAAAVDLPTVIALCNQIRTAMITFGLGV